MQPARSSIAREEYGEVRISPVAGEVVSQYVAFERPFNEKPFVVLNPQTSTPNNVRINAGTISNTGFYIYAWRNSDTNITASWMAKGFQTSIDRIEAGRTGYIEVSGGSIADYHVDFSQPFESAPAVTCSIATASNNINYANMSVGAINVSNEGFDVRIWNKENSASPAVTWIAANR